MANFKYTVERCGGKSYKWKQSRAIGKQTFGKNGLCAPLAAKWIRDRKIHINFKHDTATTEGWEEIMQLKILQHDKRNTEDFSDAYLKLFGIQLNSTLKMEHALSIDKLTDMATAIKGYYLLIISSFHDESTKKPESHALAIDTYTNSFFDPNFGQATFKKNEDLKSFIKQWLRLTYPDLDGFSYVKRFN